MKIKDDVRSINNMMQGRHLVLKPRKTLGILLGNLKNFKMISEFTFFPFSTLSDYKKTCGGFFSTGLVLMSVSGFPRAIYMSKD